MVLPLAGCFDDRRAQVGKCEYEAQKAFPAAQLARSVDMGRMMKACMRAAGYDYDMYLDKCPASFETEANPDCYRAAK
jgi:hypothetical protein